MQFVILATVIRYKVPKYGSYEYPDWAMAVGWMVGFASVVPIPLLAAHSLFTALSAHSDSHSLLVRVRSAFRPSRAWRTHLEHVVAEAKAQCRDGSLANEKETEILDQKETSLAITCSESESAQQLQHLHEQKRLQENDGQIFKVETNLSNSVNQTRGKLEFIEDADLVPIDHIH